MNRKSLYRSGSFNPHSLIALVVCLFGVVIALIATPSPAEFAIAAGVHGGNPDGTAFVAPDVQQGWVARYDGPGNYDDEATAVAVDGSGNVYVAGFSFDPNTDYDYTTIKYNSAGQQQWIARYDGPINYTDKATAIAVDASGNVYVTGASSSSAGAGGSIRELIARMFPH
jgi:hypothetical protein